MYTELPVRVHSRGDGRSAMNILYIELHSSPPLAEHLNISMCLSKSQNWVGEELKPQWTKCGGAKIKLRDSDSTTTEKIKKDY